MAFDLSSLTSLLKKEIASASFDGGFVGVDIGASSIKVVQLKDEKGIPTLETYGELQLGPYEKGDVGRVVHLPPHKIIEALVDILRESGASATHAAIAYSYNTSFINAIAVPTLERGRIDSMVPVEARKYVPISLSKVTLEWTELGIDDEKKETRVLLIAKSNDALARYTEVMHGARLEVEMSELEIFSTVRAVVAPEDTSVAILDMGASATRLYVVEGGFVQETHSVPLSGVEINHALERALSINFLEAEEKKRAFGLGGNGDERVQKALTQCLDRGLRELHTVLSRYERENGREIKKIILTGGASMLQGVSGHIQDIFVRPVAYADPFAKVAYPAFLEDALKAAGPTFSVAIGAALGILQIRK